MKKINVLIIEIGIKDVHIIKNVLRPECANLIYASSFLDVVDTIYQENVHVIILSDFRGQKSTIGYIKMFKTTNPNFDLIILSAQKSLRISYKSYYIQRGAGYVIASQDINSLENCIKEIYQHLFKNNKECAEWSQCTKKAIMFLKNNYNIETDLIKNLSTNINYSVSSIQHSIKKDTGITLNNWIRDLRVKGAIKLLESTHYPVKTISNQVGYKSVQGFLKVFKKVTGKTPMHFRKDNV